MNFPDGRIPFEFEREDLAKVVKTTMEHRDTNIAGGNISIRVKDEVGHEYYVMTPTMMSEAYLGELTAEQILVIEPHTRKVVSGTGKITREINMHEAIYDVNPYIKCVFHSHADQAMFWATTGLNMPNLTEATQLLGKIRTLKWHPMCTEDLAKYVSSEIKKLGDKALENGFLLNSHGTLFTCGGKNVLPLSALHRCLADIDTVEWNAKVAFKQTLLQKAGMLDGYYSEGVKIGTWQDVLNGKALYNTVVEQNPDAH